MAKLNWKYINHFTSSEFLDDPNLARPDLIYTLDDLRRKHGKRIYPSPKKGTLARFGGPKRSQHYVGESADTITRKSTGIDIFPEGVPIEFYHNTLRMPIINGLGVYLSTTGVDGLPWVMFHIDIRDIGFKKGIPLFWIALKQKDSVGRLRTVYYYPQINPEYWKLLQNDLFYTDRIKITRTTTAS